MAGRGGWIGTSTYLDPTSTCSTPTEGVLAFANNFGMLGGSASEPCWSEDNPSRKYIGERIGRWTYLIEDMRSMVERWHQAEHADIGTLVERFDISPEKVVLLQPPFDPHLLAGPGFREEVAKEIAPGDYRLAARWLVGDHVTGLVHDHLELRISVTKQKESSSHYHVRLNLRDGLISALWLQLAFGLEHHEIRRCEACPKFIARGPGLGRADKKYCDATCRKRDHRKSKRISAS